VVSGEVSEVAVEEASQEVAQLWGELKDIDLCTNITLDLYLLIEIWDYAYTDIYHTSFFVYFWFNYPFLKILLNSCESSDL